MKEENKGRRQENGPSGFGRWVSEYRAWVAGMTRGQRIRHRILQGAALISLVIILAWAVLNFGFQPPELPGTPVNNPSSSSASGSAAMENWEVEGPNIAQSGRKEGIYTFLVAGLDQASGATDTMLLLSYNTKEKTIQGMNLPRDTIMNVSYNSKRLNTIYTINKGKDKATQVEKGMTALGKHVAKLTGITPDYYVLLEWEAIGELVDALGGVEFEVPFDMDYDDPYQDLHIHQKAGLRQLSGDDAMQVIRWRQNNTGPSPGDVGRLAIQQDFLKAVVKKCLQPATFLKIPALAEIFAENVKTDLTVGNILAFAKTAYGMDPSTGVSFQTAPLAADAWYKGAAMVTLDGEGILEVVNGGMNPYLRDIELSDLELIYKKADGSYGVITGTLADPAMGIVKTTQPEETEPEPEQPAEGEGENTEPVDPENPGATVETEDPAATEDPDQPGTEPEQPGDPQTEPSGSGEVQQPEQPGGETSGLPQTEPVVTEPETPAGGEPSENQTQQSGTGEEIPEWMIPVVP